MERSAGTEAARPLENAVLIAGPTASGKSALALEAARHLDGVVVNADSMQVYAGLSVITARPGAAETAAVPHRLYGHVPPQEAYSTGKWLRDVAALIETGELRERPAVFVGGTGLYFRALTEGLSPMPPVPAAIRARWRERLALEGPQRLHAVLDGRDPTAAAAIRPTDGQRILRALEVLEASGRSLRDWQGERAPPLVNVASARMAVLEPGRGLLAQRIAERFGRMVDEGALEEARALAARRLDPDLPAMKAIGMRELAAVLEGRMEIEEAKEKAAVATRRYAKRQVTWFRHQAGPQWRRIPVPADAPVGTLLSALLAPEAAGAG